MVLGIGVDIADILEFERIAADPVGSFIKSHFTGSEIAYCNSQISGRPAEHFAARYAAKEAAIKALDQARGDRLPAIPLDYRAIEVTSDPQGRPNLLFHGRFKGLLKSLGVGRTLLSISHDKGYAVAFVIAA